MVITVVEDQNAIATELQEQAASLVFMVNVNSIHTIFNQKSERNVTIKIPVHERPHDSAPELPRTQGLPKRYREWVHELSPHSYACAAISSTQDLPIEPIDDFAATTSPEKFQWIKAMEKEYSSLLLNKT
ncbi:unnamed protein product [Sphagnum tenellum]